MSREPVAFIGAGMVGTAMAFLLSQHGHPITGVYSRNRKSSERMCNFLGTGKIYENPGDAARTADIVFLTTPDDRISQVCAEIVQDEGFLEGAIVLHCSGALPSSTLESARDAKAHIGSMHPLQSFASLTEAVENLRQVTWAIEGDKRALDVMERLVELLNGECEILSVEHKILYHAGAVMASNYLVTLQDMAEQLLKKSGLSAEMAKQGLQSLIQGTLNNLKKLPANNALTGPIARRDVNTVRNHLLALESHAPDLLDIYKKMGQHTIALTLRDQAEDDEVQDEATRQLIQLFSDR
jgi:predicted short-subunit dehydrogenase-like oxidoreductase (DUF2520 family)